MTYLCISHIQIGVKQPAIAILLWFKVLRGSKQRKFLEKLMSHLPTFLFIVRYVLFFHLFYLASSIKLCDRKTSVHYLEKLLCLCSSRP